MKLSELLQHVPHIDVIGNIDQEITEVRELDDDAARSHTLRWCNDAELSRMDDRRSIGCIIVPAHTKVDGTKPDLYTIVRCADPRASIIAAIDLLHPDREYFGCVHYGPGGTKVGLNTVISGPGFGFHASTLRIHPGIPNSELGPIRNKEWRRFPHIGGVRIGANVEIGSNTCIDRGAIGDTVIGDGTKIDNHVHVAHNVRIGRDCIIVAGAVIGGSAVLGDRVFVGINASIKNKVRIGDDAVIGMGAVVTKDVPAGETWVGNPARKMEKP